MVRGSSLVARVRPSDGLRAAIGLATIFLGCVVLAVALAGDPGTAGARVSAIDGALVFAASAAAAACAWRSRHADRALPWRLLALGGIFAALANLTWLWVHTTQGPQIATHVVADGFNLAAYAALLAAFAAFFPRGWTRGDVPRRIADVLVIGTTFMAVAWIGFLRDAVRASGLGAGEAVILLLYPAIDIAVGTVLLAFALEVTGVRRTRFLLMAAGLGFFFFADSLQAAGIALGRTPYDFALSSFWVGGFLSFGLGALVGTAAPDGRSEPARQRLGNAVVYGPLVVLLTLAAVDLVRQRHIDPLLWFIGILIAVSLAARQALQTSVIHATNLRLAERDSLVRATQAAARIGSWERDLATGKGRWSDETWRLLGLEPRDQSPQLAEAMASIHPDDRGRYQQGLSSLAAQAGPIDLEHRIVRPDGTVRWMHTAGSSFAGPDGRPVRWAGFMQDITERKQALDELSASEAHRSAVLAAVPDLVFVFDRQRRFAQFFAGPEAKPYLPPAEFLGRGIRDVLPPGVAGLLDDAVAQTTATGATQEIEYELPSPAGPLHFEARLSPMADGGVVALVRDVTERRQAGARLEEAMVRLNEAQATAHIGSWSTDFTTGASEWSDEAWRIYGLDPGTSKPSFELFLSRVHPDDRASVEATAHQGVQAGTAVEFECRIVRPDGSIRYLLARNVPTVVEGRPVRLLGTNQDITERKLAEAKVREADALRDTARFKTEFLNMAAHELATPITPLRLQLASLQSGAFGPLSDVQREALGLLDRNVDRLGNLVQDLLDAARLQSGQLRLSVRPVALKSIVGDTVGSFADKAREQGIALASDAREDLTVQCDGLRMAQVLTNLVSNALKFTPRGGSVEIKVRRDGPDAVLAVRDSGVGLRPDQIERLFQPFTQVHDTAQHNVGGTGLGLYISRGIVEQHGCTLECSSDGPGQGATFTVRLPLASVVAQQPSAAKRN